MLVLGATQYGQFSGITAPVNVSDFAVNL